MCRPPKRPPAKFSDKTRSMWGETFRGQDPGSAWRPPTDRGSSRRGTTDKGWDTWMCFKNDARILDDPNPTPPLGMRTPRGFRMPLWPEDRDRRRLVKAPVNRLAAALGFAMGPFDLADHEPSCRYRRTVYALRDAARFVGRAARTFAIGWTP